MDELREPDYGKIGARIRDLRERQGLTQEDLAERTGLSRTHISHIETGRTKGSYPAFIAIANALQVGLDDLSCDSLGHEVVAYQKEIAALLEDCTPLEIRVVADTVRAAKQIMRERGLTK